MATASLLLPVISASVEETVSSEDWVVSVISDCVKKQVVVSVQLSKPSTVTTGCFNGSLVASLLGRPSSIVSTISMPMKEHVEDWVSGVNSVPVVKLSMVARGSYR